MKSAIRFISYPRTEPPPQFVLPIVEIFRTAESQIGSEQLAKGLKSDAVLALIYPQLEALGFQVEKAKSREQKIDRPVFFGENGVPSLRYQIDAYHVGWRCGLEIEAGRASMGNAVYRDIVQAMVMVQVDHLVVAVPNSYKYRSGGKPTSSSDYRKTIAVAEALYSHTRVRLPYGLTVIGY